MFTASQIVLEFLDDDPSLSDLINCDTLAVTLVDTYWNGDAAPAGRHFTAGLAWSSENLAVVFRASQTEPLVVSDEINLTSKTIGLWERDVCEIFIAPDAAATHRYFEFEAAPTGEWVDLAIDCGSEKRETDLEYKSGMTSAARIEKNEIVMAIKIPWEAFGVARPKVGDVWLGNLFRCVGKGTTRGYLAWQPTKTAKPNFHVPERFGEFRFV